MESMRVMLFVVALAACDRLYSASAPHHDAALDPDGDAPTDAAPLPMCTPMSMLVADFASDPTFQTGWWSGEASGGVTFTGSTTSVLSVQFPTAMSGGHAAIAANAYFDLRETSFSIEVAPGAIPADGVITLSLLDLSQSNSLVIEVASTTISFTKIEHGMTHTLGSGLYSVGDRFWRIQQQGNLTTWWTSSDGVMYTMRAQDTDLAWASFLRPTITIDRPSSMIGFTLQLDKVNTGSSVGAACPIALLRDDFSASALANHWYTRISPPGAGGVFSTGGQLFLSSQTGTSTSVTALVSSTLYDLTADRFTLELLSPTNGSNIAARWGVFTATGDSASFEQTSLGYRAKHGDVSVANATGQTPPLWWQLHETGGQTEYLISDDGTSWNPFVGFTGVTGLDRAQVVIGLFQTSVSSGGSARFDNVDLPP